MAPTGRKKSSQGRLFFLGMLHDDGNGIERNPREANKYYLKAAEIGSRSAKFALGVNHLTGRGTDQNLKKALYWFKQASDSWHSAARCQVARFHEYGLTVPRDLKLALDHLEILEKNAEPKTANCLHAISGVRAKLKAQAGDEGLALRIGKAYASDNCVSIKIEPGERARVNCLERMHLSIPGAKLGEARYYLNLAKARGSKEAAEILRGRRFN